MEQQFVIRMRVDEISKTKHGALIVFRKDNGVAQTDSTLRINELGFPSTVDIDDEVEVTIRWHIKG